MNEEQPKHDTRPVQVSGAISITIDPFRPGGPCPNCGKGKLDYNGLLELECPVCGFLLASGAGCT